ncbi:hypothetical protein B0H14DRAFT_3515461 [Mycena olivaceomarginata]|nr:hypothetical protein B0H14DRAFT_3515461 [Mycena olivaceomarginata]
MLSRTDLILPVAHSLLAHSKIASPIPTIKSDGEPGQIPSRHLGPRSLRFASLARSVSSPLSDFSDDSRGAETTPVAQNALPAAGVQHSLKSIKTISTSRQKTIMERIAVLAPKMLNERSSFKEQNLQRYQAFETKMLEEFPVLKAHVGAWPLQNFVTYHLKKQARKRKDRVLKEVVIAAVQG